MADRGATASIATSWDGSHPPENVLDGSESTFWVTTGMFPQELVITLGANADVSRVAINGAGLRRISIASCTSEQPGAYDTVLHETDLERVDGRQSEVFKVKMSSVRHVKLTIHAGWEHFVSISSVRLEP
ncbi:galactose-binding domain-like protein [Pavlovales sp. CCMP2436]|nr:galactose-binding domain-like protein [Pavlovales sp. CCMP2436]